MLPELALCLFAYARDVNEGLLQHGLSLVFRLFLVLFFSRTSLRFGRQLNFQLRLLNESLESPVNEAPCHLGRAAAKNSSLHKLFEELLRLRRNGDSDGSAVYTVFSLCHKLALIMAYLCQMCNEDFARRKGVLPHTGNANVTICGESYRIVGGKGPGPR